MFTAQTKIFYSIVFGISLSLALHSNCFAQLRNGPPADGSLPIGFAAADEDSDGCVTKTELTKYLEARLVGAKIPFAKVFEQLDKDKNDSLSKLEFAKRQLVLEEILGPMGGGPMPKDPGKGFVFLKSLRLPIDDRGIQAAVFHRSMELSSNGRENKSVKKVPKACKLKRPSLPTPHDKTNPIRRLADATLILSGGSDGDFFTGGAVVVSKDGLAVTNYHIAQVLKKGQLIGFTSDGKPHRVTEWLAGDKVRDVALIRLEGAGFTPVPIAKETPSAGENIEMIHHSEERFYTYDRGYIMRYPMVGNHPWMEISADYAPGGSGCGIFNRNHELIGLVSMIKFGSGPMLGEEFDMDESEFGGANQDMELDAHQGPPQGMLLVKHAVPLSAIRGLWKSRKRLPDPAGNIR